MTTRLFNIMQAELIKRGFNEFVDPDGNLVFFDDDYQFMNKIFRYDQDVSSIVDDLFCGQTLADPDHDQHFKKAFLFRFINRQINRQTVEAFRLQLMATFLANEQFINSVYRDLDKYLTNTSTNNQKNNQKSTQTNDGESVTDNRSAFSDLPQDTVNLDVDDSVMRTANDNTVSRSKQRNNQSTDAITSGDTMGESKSYQLDNLFKSTGLMPKIYDTFDRQCFMQIW